MEPVEGASSSGTTAKMRVVRVKRKREHAPIDNLWLEVSDPPSKRHAPDISTLTLSSKLDSLPSTSEEAPSKLLFRRVETVSPSSKTEASLYKSLLEKVNARRQSLERRKEQRESRAKSKVHGQLLAAAKGKHEADAKKARFEQVWKSRRDLAKTSSDGDDADRDPMRDFFHVYDVVRVDVGAEAAENIARREKARREAELAQGALLCNYLPLLREILPEAAADLEQDLDSMNVPIETDDYVYDVYAMDEGFSDEEGGEEEFYPTVQIVETEQFDWREPVGSEYDSEDSNDENNPLNDYPDEDDFGDFGEKKSSNDSDGSGDVDPYASDDEDYDTIAFDNEVDLRWGRRL